MTLVVDLTATGDVADVAIATPSLELVPQPGSVVQTPHLCSSMEFMVHVYTFEQRSYILEPHPLPLRPLGPMCCSSSFLMVMVRLIKLSMFQHLFMDPFSMAYIR